MKITFIKSSYTHFLCVRHLMWFYLDCAFYPLTVQIERTIHSSDVRENDYKINKKKILKKWSVILNILFIFYIFSYFSHLYYNIYKILNHYLYNRNMCKKSLEIVLKRYVISINI